MLVITNHSHFFPLDVHNKQYMMLNKQLATLFLPTNNNPTSQSPPIKQSPLSPTDSTQSIFQSVFSCIINKKFSEAFSQCSRLKLPALAQLTRIAYEHHLLRYLLHTRDKIFQVAPEQHLLTQSGMSSLRTLGAYREQAVQAKVNYGIIAENIKKLANSPTFFQCTIPNKPELADIKSSLLHLFQEIKNKQRQSQSQTVTYASSQATDKENPVNQCKECILDIISLIIPTQTMKSTLNRQKSLQELTTLAKDHIKDVFYGFKHELQMVQSRAHFCERSLQSERNVKQERQRQLQELKEELASSQKYIADLQGLQAVTEMENLGLHSKIKTEDGSKEYFEEEIERLRMSNDDLSAQLTQTERILEDFKLEIEEIKGEEVILLEEKEKLNTVVEQLVSKKEQLLMQLQAQHSRQKDMENVIAQAQKQIQSLQQQILSQSDTLKTSILQNTSLKLEKQHLQSEFVRLEKLHHNCKDLSQELTKLQQQMQCLISQNTYLSNSLHQESQHRIKSDALVEQLHKMLQQSQHQRASLQQEIEILINQNQNYCHALSEAQERIQTAEAEGRTCWNKQDFETNYPL